MYATDKYIKLMTTALAQKSGVAVKEGKDWSADTKNRILYYKPSDLRSFPFEVARGVVLHEIGHIRNTVNPVPSKKVLKYGEPLHRVYNAFEDMRIERQMKIDYGNYADSALDAASSFTANQITQSKSKSSSKLNQILETIMFRYAADTYNGVSVNPQVGWGAYNVIKNQELFDKDTMDLWEANHRKFDNAIDYAKNKAVNTTDIQNYVDKNIVPIIKDLLKKEPNDKVPPTPMKREGVGGNGFSVKDNGRTIEIHKEEEAEAVVYPYATTLSQRLNSVLKERAMIHWRGAHKSGKLLSKNAYKVCIPNEDRVFSKRTTPDIPKYTFYMALDASGSMRGPRSVNSFLGAVLLKSTCKSLGFRTVFVKYDTEAETMTNLDSYNAVGGGTDDTAPLRLINDRIDPNEDNIIIILTDGDTERHSEFEDLVRELETRKNATIFGVGIGEETSGETIRRNYKNPVFVSRVEELPQAIIGIMRKVIQR